MKNLKTRSIARISAKKKYPPSSSKNSVFVNFSNHPSKTWNEKQINAAAKYGKIVDYAFPEVDPDISEKEINKMARTIARDISNLSPSAVMCQGEFTLCHSVINYLASSGITVLASCSRRDTVQIGDRKISSFRFVRFRKYNQ